MCVGLAWRGGTVILVNGPRENADSLFQQWDSNGETHVLPADGPPRSSASDIESSESGEDSGDVDDDGANEVPATNKAVQAHPPIALAMAFPMACLEAPGGSAEKSWVTMSCYIPKTDSLFIDGVTVQRICDEVHSSKARGPLLPV
ncbi:hypothetical protein F5877DRAFT_85554 [Lentinula edodes]|nr:hypothetical protein F5877DRAFT_85554 [Lentinula edodes]